MVQPEALLLRYRPITCRIFPKASNPAAHLTSLLLLVERPASFGY